MKKRFLLMTMVLAVGLEGSGYFAISYAGIYVGASGDFYEFRCHG